jgi:hypothetical protein
MEQQLFAKCPKCGGVLNADDFDSDGETVWRTVECENEKCQWKYTEVYAFFQNETFETAVPLDEKGEITDMELHQKRLESWKIGEF